MFDWSQGTALRAMIDGNVPGAVWDDWLEGWMFGFVESRIQFQCPGELLDVKLGDGPRPYLDVLSQRGITVSSADADLVTSRQSAASHAREYDAVLLLSLEREACLKPLDLENPLGFVEMLLNATMLLKPGGALIWSYLHCFSSSPDHLHDLLEPAAVYQTLIRRKFRHIAPSQPFGVGRVAMLTSGDTLFVPQKSILSVSDRQERVTRICAGVARYGTACRVRYLQTADAISFPAGTTPDSPSPEPTASSQTVAQ